ncbi:MAG: hypothetical protein IJ515_00635 [Clostridia bacterium]|nr:hypothetical protein [Clostridia bacterium]
MKRTIKILSIILSVALIAAGVMLAVSAEDVAYDTGFTYTSYADESTVYTATDLGTALENAKAGTTVTMHGDTTYVAPASATKIADLYAYNETNEGGPLTLDLGGHTLTVIQQHKENYIALRSQNKFTVKNGTVKVLFADSTDPETQKSHPLFSLRWGSAQLVLENVNTYAASFVYAPGASYDVKVTVKGGTHYVIGKVSDSKGGFVESRTPIIFNAKGATFYVADESTLLTSLIYPAYNNSANWDNTFDYWDLESSFVFTNCNVLSEKITTSLIKYANQYTTVKFNNSHIYGSLGRLTKDGVIQIDMEPWDTEYTDGAISPIEAGDILLGPGTTYATADGETKAYFANGVAVGDYTNPTAVVASYYNLDTNGEKIYYTESISEELTVTLNLPNDERVTFTDAENNVYTYDYSTTATKRIYTFDTEERVPEFYYSGTDTYYYYGDISLYDVLSNAESGTTVQLLCDVEVYPEGNGDIAIIKAGITFDLNGKTLSINQVKTTDGPNGESTIEIDTTETVTLKNGTVGVKHTDTTSAYPLFRNGDHGYAVNLNIENVTSYSGGLVYAFSGNGSNINITGGEHYVIYTAQGSIGGIVGMLCSGNVKVSDALVYVGSRGRLFGAASRTVSLYNPGVEFVVENSEIIAEKVTHNIIQSANEFTTVYFRNSYVYGSLAPVSNNGYDNNNQYNPFVQAGITIGQPDANTVMLDSASYYTSSATVTDGVVSPEVGIFVSGASTLDVTLKLLEGDPAFYGFKGVATAKSYTFDRTVSGDYFEVTTNGVVTYLKGSIQEAVTAADAGTTIKFLGNYTADGSHVGYNTATNPNRIVNIDKALTFDLDGRTLTIKQGNVQAAGKEAIVITKNVPVVFQNGTITAVTVKSTDASHVGRSYPIFEADGTDFDITLTNLKTYSGALFYSYDKSGTFTVEGGEHHAIYNTHNNYTATWFAVRNGVDFVANDATFYSEDGISLFCARSSSYTGKLNYTFTNCNVITEGGNSPIFNHANDLTTIAFNDCRVYGKLTPALDTTNGRTAITSITLGVGTLYGGTYTDGLLVAGEGGILENVSTTQGVPVYKLLSTDVIIDAEKYTTDFTSGKVNEQCTFTVEITGGVIVDIYDPATDTATSATLAPGAAIPVPSIDTTTVDSSSGWYKLSYTGGWVDAEGNVVSNLVATGSTMQLYPEVAVTPYLTAARYNLVLMGHVGLYFYIPTEYPDNVELVSVVNSADKTISASTTSATFYGDSAKYRKYALGSISATQLAVDVTLTVNFNVTLDGNQVKSATQTVTLSPIGYAKQLLNDTTGAYDKAKPMMADMVRYTHTLMSFEGLTSRYNFDIVDALYNSEVCTENLTALDTKYFTTATDADAPTALADYIEKVSFQVYDYQPRYRIKLKEGSKVTAVSFTVVEGWIQGYNTAEGGNNWGTDVKTYSPNASWGTSYWTTEGLQSYCGNYTNDAWTANNGAVASDDSITSYICVASPDNMPIYHINKQIRITLTFEDGATVSGIYDLPTYYQNLQSSGDESFAATADVLLAMDAYARSVAAYRFGPPRANGNLVHDAR